MSLRQSPFTRTCRNFYFNIKNYKSSRQRPSFKSSNHPFCTNSQLLDASYTNWLVKTSKEIPSKLFSQITEKHDSERRYGDTRERPFNFVLPSSICISQMSNIFHIPPEITVDDYPSHSSNNDSNYYNSITGEILKLTKDGNIAMVAEKLRNYKDQKTIIQPNLINEIMDEIINKSPNREVLPTECEVEIPRHQSFNSLEVDTPYYKYIYERIPHLYQICQTYEKIMFNNKRFQENYIWICYHMDDLDTLQNLVYVYLKNPNYNSRILSYIMSGFILNYEVEFSKNLFQNLVSLGKGLDSKLLENVIFQLIKVDSLFENLISVLQVWIKNENCPSPSPKIMALLLKEYYKFGNKEEIIIIGELTKSLNLSAHYLIRSINLQSNIMMREPTSFKKNILETDIIEFNEISSSLKHANKIEELVEFYYLFLDFFAKYSNIKMIQFIIFKMKKDNLELNESFFKLIARFYVKSEKFLQLLTFLQNSSNKLTFNEIFLKNLFESFIKAYPYYAPEFTESFHNWIKGNEHLSEYQKNKLLQNLNICKIESQLTPYNLARNLLNPKKYDSANWLNIVWKHGTSGKSVKFTDQVNFRINKGFRDILRKGVKPDFKIIETTFRRSNLTNRKRIMELLKTIRLFDSQYQKFNIYNLQIESTKDNLISYYKNNKISQLNSNNKLLLSRIFMNKKLYYETNEILKDIKLDEINDKSLMYKLNIQLRNYLTFSKFEEFDKIVDDFPINDIILSPYIYKQCCFIEKQLLKKLSLTQLKQQQHHYCHEDDAELQQSLLLKHNLLKTLKKLRGLIGDISLRLDKDKSDINKEVKEMFKFLDTWIVKSHNRDERKV